MFRGGDEIAEMAEFHTEKLWKSLFYNKKVSTHGHAQGRTSKESTNFMACASYRRMVPLRFVLLCSALSLPFGSFAQSPPPALKDDPALDAKAITQQIESLAQARAQRKNQFLADVREKVLHASQSPGAAGNFVIDCYRQVDFAGRSGGGNEFSKWKKDHPDVGSSQDVELACNLHLRYLAITLKRAMVDSAEPVLPDVWAYLDALMKSQDALERIGTTPSGGPRPNAQGFAQIMLGTGVDQGWPAQSLGVGKYLSGISDWSLMPADFSQILEKDIRVCLRKNSDPRLISTWDYEIAYQGDGAKRHGEKAAANFNEVTMPRLLWKKAEDMEKIGMPNRALNLKISIVKQHPEHPDFEQWVDGIETALKGGQSVAPGDAPDEPEENAPMPQSGAAR
jgi:hypothetical protein